MLKEEKQLWGRSQFSYPVANRLSSQGGNIFMAAFQAIPGIVLLPVSFGKNKKKNSGYKKARVTGAVGR